MEFWICLVFAVSTLMATQANIFTPGVQQHLVLDSKLHINRQLREAENISTDCGHDDWPASASVDQIEGAWEVQMSNRPPTEEHETLCADLSFSKINDTSTNMNMLHQKLDPTGLNYLCSYQDNGLYTCDERDRPIRNPLTFRIFPQSPCNAYMILSPCDATVDWTFVISRRNVTLSPEDLENLDTLRQELGFETYHNIRQCN